MREKSSIIWKISKEEFQNLFNENNSITDILKKLGYDGYNGNARTIWKRAKDDNICLMKFEENKIKYTKNKPFNNKLSFDKVFFNGSTKAGITVKRIILKNKLIEYVCAVCLNEGMFLNKPLSLQLDHINGISTDNRLENLRFLCPNCHSQTETFSGKNTNRHKTSYKKTRILKFHVTKENLNKLLQNNTISAIAKQFGVSATSVKKRMKFFNLERVKGLEPL